MGCQFSISASCWWDIIVWWETGVLSLPIAHWSFVFPLCVWLEISQCDCWTDSDGLAEKAHGCEITNTDTNRSYSYKNHKHWGTLRLQIYLRGQISETYIKRPACQWMFMFFRQWWFLIEGFLILLHTVLANF